MNSIWMLLVSMLLTAHTIAKIPLGSSRHVSTRLDTFDVPSPCVLAVSSLLNSMARHSRHIERVET